MPAADVLAHFGDREHAGTIRSCRAATSASRAVPAAPAGGRGRRPRADAAPCARPAEGRPRRRSPAHAAVTAGSRSHRRARRGDPRGRQFAPSRPSAHARRRDPPWRAAKVSRSTPYDGLPGYGTFAHLSPLRRARARGPAARGRTPESTGGRFPKLAAAGGVRPSPRPRPRRSASPCSYPARHQPPGDLDACTAARGRVAASRRTVPTRGRWPCRRRAGCRPPAFPRAEATPTGPRGTPRWRTGSTRAEGVHRRARRLHAAAFAPFLARFPQAVINVHPSLLPAFPGLRPIQEAIAYGVQVFGVTVHFVDDGVDSGPIILQRAVALPGADDPSEVLDRLPRARARTVAGGRPPGRPRGGLARRRQPAPRADRSRAGHLTRPRVARSATQRGWPRRSPPSTASRSAFETFGDPSHPTLPAHHGAWAPR